MLVTNPEPATPARCALSRAEGPHLQLPIGDARDIGCGPKVAAVGPSPPCLTYVSLRAARRLHKRVDYLEVDAAVEVRRPTPQVVRSCRDGAESGSATAAFLAFPATVELPGHVCEGDTTRYPVGRSRSELAAVPIPRFLDMKTARDLFWMTKDGSVSA
jgi:hypothetical protein